MEWMWLLAVPLIPLLVLYCARCGSYGFFRGRDVAARKKERQIEIDAQNKKE